MKNHKKMDKIVDLFILRMTEVYVENESLETKDIHFYI